MASGCIRFFSGMKMTHLIYKFQNDICEMEENITPVKVFMYWKFHMVVEDFTISCSVYLFTFIIQEPSIN